MSCEERVETKTRVWGWCSGWPGIPYPCRKIKTELWYQYEFHQTRYVPSWFPFWEKKKDVASVLSMNGGEVFGGIL